MRALIIFTKSLREQLQDIWVLFFALITAPGFVLLYWMLTGGGSTTYQVLVLNKDQPAQLASGKKVAIGESALQAMRKTTYPNGQPMLKIRPIKRRAEAVTLLKNREAMALLILPRDLSRALATPQAIKKAPQITLVGDLTNPLYIVAALMATNVLDQTAQGLSQKKPLFSWKEEPLGASGNRTEFEGYVPGLLLIAIMLMIFTSAMSVAREVEAGTLRRLQLSRMTAFDYIAGVSATQVLVAGLSLAITLLVAWSLGFRSLGSLWAAFLVGFLTALPVIGVGLIVACFSKTVIRAFLFANIPFMLFMFFSGAVYPMAKIKIFSLAGQTVGLFDFLPTTHAVLAINKILTLGASLSGVLFELSFLVILSLLYFFVGVWLFHRNHLRPA